MLLLFSCRDSFERINLETTKIFIGARRNGLRFLVSTAGDQLLHRDLCSRTTACITPPGQANALIQCKEGASQASGCLLFFHFEVFQLLLGVRYFVFFLLKLMNVLKVSFYLILILNNLVQDTGDKLLRKITSTFKEKRIEWCVNDLDSIHLTTNQYQYIT